MASAWLCMVAVLCSFGFGMVAVWRWYGFGTLEVRFNSYGLVKSMAPDPVN